ncbi:hypothetical protein ES689_00210 [Frigoribacterium sp. ACAM 257]|uniref:hypothetical protein n=1 Tax=Frigoribacterium sp. ACAM 257 TaxID=2508998 RepID=UPI0011B96380|nr:hypothetical protein [Frigoribacterium sp. ACAM 257]TWX39965.1 hypothetical protein ES689_00210 [Frigoribacterium sp. ACAM 257]
MTDPDELGGSAADRRFREALREGLAAAERESRAENQAENQAESRAESQAESRAGGPDGDAPVVPRAGGPERASRKPPRSRSEVFMDWAPLAVAVLAIGAVIGIALYGINGGDLGPW